MEFGEILKQLRADKKWSQRDLSKAIGISQPTIYEYERGVSMPRPEVIIKISKAFDVSTDYLLGIDDDTLSQDERLDKMANENPLLSDKKKLEFVKSLSEEEAERLLVELKKKFPHKY